MLKKGLVLALLYCFCFGVAGCGGYEKTIGTADQWVREKMW